MKTTSFLNITKAVECERCRNAKERATHMVDGFCAVPSTIDDLKVRCVGGWGKDKVYFVATYVDIVGNALHRKFDINYIEICSGPGRCIDYDNGEEFNGTPLAVLSTPGTRNLSNLFFFDINPIAIEILEKRITHQEALIFKGDNPKVNVNVGDYLKNESIVDVVEKSVNHSSKCLNIVLIDPTDLSVPYEMYEALMDLKGKTDFIINFAEGTDLRRNIVRAAKNPNSPVGKKYSKALKNKKFFFSTKLQSLIEQNNHEELVESYLHEFLSPFKMKGFIHIQETKIEKYYKLIYLSQNALGAKFWSEASRKSAIERESRQGLLL